jgi:hypothetical protein
VSVKPRQVDFELFHQSAEAENCYGPFTTRDLSDPKVSFDWADADTRLIWQGYLDTSKLVEDPERGNVKDMVLRIDLYVGERDSFGMGFSDNVIFRKQYYLRAILSGSLTLYCHTDERFMAPDYVLSERERMRETPDGWEFDVAGTGFKGTFGVRLDHLPLDGAPVPLRKHLANGEPAPEVSGMPKLPGEAGIPGA